MDTLINHLRTGATTVCRAWVLTRVDGVTFGFTDHDLDLSFDGITFRANGGLTASALLQTSGLSVDNSEALGAFQDDAITEEDLDAGLYDGAEVRCFQVNWSNLNERRLLYRAYVGDVVRGAGAFRTELRGLTDLLNQPQGRSYYRDCACVVGADDCGFDPLEPGFYVDLTVDEVEAARTFRFDLPGFEPGWFTRGVMEVLSGASAGLRTTISSDVEDGARRRIDLMQTPRRPISVGDQVRLIAGAEVRQQTAATQVDFCGFPFIPGDDWLVSVPVRGDVNNGGRRRG